MIEKTTNYDQFVILSQNREVKRPQVENMKRSLQIKNLLHLNPILVNENMEVLDGQHRLKAAQELGLEVCYTIERQLEVSDIPLLNNAQAAWTRGDYLRFYSKGGSVVYRELEKLVEESPVSLNEVLLILGKDRARSRSFRNGELNYTLHEFELARQHVAQIEELLKAFRKVTLSSGPWLKSTRLIRGVIALVKNDQYIHEVMLHKISVVGYRLKKVVDSLAYLEQLENIYNYRNNEPLEIKP